MVTKKEISFLLNQPIFSTKYDFQLTDNWFPLAEIRFYLRNWFPLDAIMISIKVSASE